VKKTYLELSKPAVRLRISGKLKSPYPTTRFREKTRNPVSPSDQHLPPDIERLIEFLMQFLEKEKRHPILLSSADDYDRFLKWKEIDPSSLICLDDQLRQRVSRRS
jgi:hypothetical protein